MCTICNRTVATTHQSWCDYAPDAFDGSKRVLSIIRGAFLPNLITQISLALSSRDNARLFIHLDTPSVSSFLLGSTTVVLFVFQTR